MRPYLTYEETLLIFGREFAQDTELTALFGELLGISGIKPFECVGTNEETAYCVWTLWEKGILPKETPLLQLFAEKVLPNLTKEKVADMREKLFGVEGDSLVPEEFLPLLENL